MLTIAFTGGGTGGHIYPGLAVIEYLLEHSDGKEFRVIWIGSNKGRDRSMVESFTPNSKQNKIEFFGIPAGKLRRYFSLKTIPDSFKVIAGYFAARTILKKQKVDLLFSKGGFVSVPPCAAAASLKITVFTHESDFSPGLATRLNLRFVLKTGGKVFTAYPETAEFLKSMPGDQVVTSGNPVRSAFRSACPANGRAFLGLEPHEKILLILGGSQGAKEINVLVKASLDSLQRHYTVVHQTGADQGWDLPKAGKYIPLAYIHEEMPHVLAAAELVAGRSGAGTVWESAAAGKPMILIPLSGSGTRGDQVENARFFERAGAALMLAGNDASPENFSRAVNETAGDSGRLQRMAESARRIGSLDGAAIIGDSIIKAIKEHGCC